MRQLWRDLKFGVRTLAKNPGFTVVAVLTLALGIGATTVIFSAVNSILLQPFTFRDADRITFFYIHDPLHPSDDGRSYYSLPELMDFREQNHVFEDVVGMTCQNVLYSRNGANEGARQFRGCVVTGNAFAFYGVKPLFGRWLTEEDAKPGAPPVFALDYRRWKSQFNSDPKILGTSFVFDGKPATLVAIMPPRYTLGEGDVWMPIALTHSDVINKQIGIPFYLEARGRLKPGVSPRAAAADLDMIARRLSTVYTKDYPKQFTVVTKSLTDAIVGDFRGMLYALMAAVAMLLLIACSNVANLLLVRATAREKEMALRAALGATRGRIIRQLIAESVVLSRTACVIGCALAYFALKAVVALVPIGAEVPTNAAFGLNARALWFCVGTASFATLLCGLAPAIHAVRGELSTRLTGVAKGMGGGHRHDKLRSVLVVAEVALSVFLLIGTGLMARTLLALEHVVLGFNPKNVLFVGLAMPEGRYDTAEQKRIFFDQAVARISALPGVVSATQTITVPPYQAIRTDADTLSLEGLLKEFFYAGPEFGLVAFSAFGAIGLVLVIIGVFTVMKYAVTLRTHEIGVRMALGAQRRDILRMILRKGAILIGAGPAAGVALSYALARLMASQVWGVSTMDPATLGAVVAIVAVVGLAACSLPAMFATRVDPNVALRYE